MAVILETSLGDITVDLYTSERPRCSLNFLKLCKVKYYNYCLFHSVQHNLAAQAGDPEGTGRGGQSIYAMLYGDQAAYFEAEVKPRIKHTKKGLLSMVNDGRNMHGSQFFFTLAESLDSLDKQGHTVFGEVSEGMEVLDKINEAFCDAEGVPYQNIRVYHTVVLDDPYDDPEGLVIPAVSPVPTKEQLDNGRIEADEEIDPYAGKSEVEVKELTEEKEAKANAQLLEMVGDLPDQEVAPPDNVLFVCKLNPVTTDDDLEIIFSRFGPICSCEVIRDFKTKESLQYAFIEFEKPEDCENAYFKMDNVLIDDRRIHVDFSQSVSKLKWKGKGKGVEHVNEERRTRDRPDRLYQFDRDLEVVGSKARPADKGRTSFKDKPATDWIPQKADGRRSKPGNDDHLRDHRKHRSGSEDSDNEVSHRSKYPHEGRSRDRDHVPKYSRDNRARERSRENRSRDRDHARARHRGSVSPIDDRKYKKHSGGAHSARSPESSGREHSRSPARVTSSAASSRHRQRSRSPGHSSYSSKEKGRPGLPVKDGHRR